MAAAATAAPQTAEGARAWQALCSFCGWALYAEPDEETLAHLVRERIMFSEPPFSQAALTGARRLGETLEAVFVDNATFATFVRDVRLDHTYLFSLIGQSRTSPFESVYRTDDATMFGPTTLEVREAYRTWGLMLEREGSEPDDHVGAEFTFVAHLLGCAAEALEGDAVSDATNSQDAFAALRAFLSEHLLVFGPLYLRNVGARANTRYYQAIAQLAAEVLDALADALGAQSDECLDEERFILNA